MADTLVTVSLTINGVSVPVQIDQTTLEAAIVADPAFITAVSTAMANTAAVVDISAVAQEVEAYIQANPPQTTSPPAGTASTSGSTIPPSTSLVDAQGNVWTLVSGVVYENGKTAGKTGGVILVLYLNGEIYQQITKNQYGEWWGWVNNAWVAVAADPRT